MVDVDTLNRIAPRKGRGNWSPDDLVCWKHAIHVAHTEAGDQYDINAYLFFFQWYCDMVE
jgi:hypothetical protein